MSSEFMLRFQDDTWRAADLDAIRQRIAGLETFSGCRDGIEFRLTGTESRRPGSWRHDARPFLGKDHIVLEISAHPASKPTCPPSSRGSGRADISIADEDGVPSGW